MRFVSARTLLSASGTADPSTHGYGDIADALRRGGVGAATSNEGGRFPLPLILDAGQRVGSVVAREVLGFDFDDKRRIGIAFGA